jgi:tetratricopeptide (TPR) repeat protein
MNKLLIFFLLVAFHTNAQTNKAATVKTEVLELKIENLQKQLDDAKQHNKELQEAYKDEVLKVMEEKKDAIDTRMLIYVSIFVVAFITAIGFFKWLGKSEIRNIINNQATLIIDEQIKIKLSDSVIDEKLTSLGKPIIEDMLMDIEERRNLVSKNLLEIEESNRKYKELVIELNATRVTDNTETESTPEQKAKVKEFAEVLDKVKEENEYNSEDWYLKGKEAYYNGDYDQAITFYDNSIALDAENGDAFFYRGLTKYRNSDYEPAAADFTAAINAGLYFSGLFFIRASALTYLNRPKEALIDVNKAIELEPEHERAKELKGEILDLMKKK